MQKLITASYLNRGLLIFLLALRLLLSFSISWSEKFVLPLWEDNISLCISYILISTLLWINRSNLNEINVDIFFIIVFSVLGVIYAFLTPLALGISIGMAAILNIYVLLTSKRLYSKNEHSRTSIFVFLLTFLVLDFAYFFLAHRARFSMGGLNYINAIFWTNPPIIAAEEFIFRGLLWKLLRDFGYTENKVIYIQAFLFWVFHFYLEPIFFWIFLPLISILFGYLVSRTKSISYSMILHFTHNIFSFIFRF